MSDYEKLIRCLDDPMRHQFARHHDPNTPGCVHCGRLGEEHGGQSNCNHDWLYARFKDPAHPAWRVCRKCKKIEEYLHKKDGEEND